LGLKKILVYVIPAVANLINASFRKSKVPHAWKLVNVTPLPKTVAIEDFNIACVAGGIRGHERMGSLKYRLPKNDTF
jgi:hypothetical protein